MSNKMTVETCKRWCRGSRVLVEQTGPKIEIVASELNVEEQAAVCFVLLEALSDRCGMAPFAVAASEVEHVLDCLSSIAEFPSLNLV